MTIFPSNLRFVFFSWLNASNGKLLILLHDKKLSGNENEFYLKLNLLQTMRELQCLKGSDNWMMEKCYFNVHMRQLCLC